MTGILAALAGGGSSILDTQTVTRGTTTTGTDPFQNWAGYKNTGPSFGAISDGTSNIYAGATINGLYFFEEGSSGAFGYYTRQIIWEVNGTQSNSPPAWTTMTVGSTPYNNADATFSTAGGVSTWTWNIPIDPFPDPNPASPGPFNSASVIVTWS